MRSTTQSTTVSNRLPRQPGPRLPLPVRSYTAPISAISEESSQVSARGRTPSPAFPPSSRQSPAFPPPARQMTAGGYFTEHPRDTLASASAYSSDDISPPVYRGTMESFTRPDLMHRHTQGSASIYSQDSNIIRKPSRTSFNRPFFSSEDRPVVTKTPPPMLRAMASLRSASPAYSISTNSMSANNSGYLPYNPSSHPSAVVPPLGFQRSNTTTAVNARPVTRQQSPSPAPIQRSATAPLVRDAYDDALDEYMTPDAGRRDDWQAGLPTSNNAPGVNRQWFGKGQW